MRRLGVLILIVTTWSVQAQDAKAGQHTARHLNAICGITEDGDGIVSPSALVACPQTVSNLADEVLRQAKNEKATLAASCEAPSDLFQELLIE